MPAAWSGVGERNDHNYAMSEGEKIIELTRTAQPSWVKEQSLAQRNSFSNGPRPPTLSQSVPEMPTPGLSAQIGVDGSQVTFAASIPQGDGSFKGKLVTAMASIGPDADVGETPPADPTKPYVRVWIPDASNPSGGAAMWFQGPPQDGNYYVFGAKDTGSGYDTTTGNPPFAWLPIQPCGS